jgi:soluble cytochrome b562
MLALIQPLRTFFAICITCFAVHGVVIVAHAQSDPTVQTKVEEPPTLEKLDFDFDLPPDLQTELPQEPARIVPERNRGNTWFDLSFLAGFFRIVFWVMFALALAFIIFSIASEIIRARKNYAPRDKTEDMPDIPVYQPNEEMARVLIDDADKLAAEGKFEEAVHLLLFRSIQDIAAKRPHYVKRSLTSREISNLPILTQKARAGFSTIGLLVENSFFGGRKLGADDYATSKTAYESFAFEKLSV